MVASKLTNIFYYGILLITLSTYSLISFPVQANQAQATADETDTVRIGNSVIKVTFAPGELAVSHTELMHWIKSAVTAVAGFYGEFPVAKLNLMIAPSRRDGLNGVAYRGIEPLIKISINSQIKQVDLDKDWVLVHELVHLAFPPVHKRHHWLEEGLATYIEPLARVQAGMQTEAEAWQWFLNGLPNGLPQTGDKGLDHTPTWGRTYWGGALFCLLADIEIRQRTSNRYALIDALRGIIAAGGSMQTNGVWPIDKALAAADASIGVSVLSELYEQMRATPVPVDLEALWQQLGVALVNKTTVSFNDQAELATLRQALMDQ